MYATMRKGSSGLAPEAVILSRKSGLLLWWFVLVAVLVFGFGGGSIAFGQCDCTDTLTTGVPQTECEVLVALYTSTNGAGWSNNTNWNSAGTSVDSWVGVGVSGGRVTSLDLFLNQLIGSIPPELENLTNLTYLSLPYNQLTGSIPPELGNLTNLTELRLYGNQLTDNIPAELAKLTNLKVLWLVENQLTGSIPIELGDLTDLVGLGLESNQLTGRIPTELGNLTDLGALVLGANQLTGSIPIELGNLTNLTHLQLYSNQLSGEIPASIINLKALGSDGWQTNIGYNMLTATDPTVISFLDSKDTDWATTQTVPPENLNTTDITGNSIKLTWTPIPYTGDGGYYRIYYATTSGGPYTEAGTTTDKSASEYTVIGLFSDTIYYFVVETFTPAHGTIDNPLEYQPNDLTSPPSNEVFARTSFSPGNINKDSAVDLLDAILVLKILAGMDIGGTEIDLNSDVDRNSQIGIENAIYILREVAGLNGQSVTEYTGQQGAGANDKTHTASDVDALYMIEP